MLYKAIERMIEVMDKDVQEAVSTMIWEKFGRGVLEGGLKEMKIMALTEEVAALTASKEICQQEVVKLVSELRVAKASGAKSAKRGKSKVPYWIREVTGFNDEKTGFAKLEGSWCKASGVGKNKGCVYVVGIKGWALKGGAQYAVVTGGTSESVYMLGGVEVKGVSAVSEFKDFGGLLEEVAREM